MTDREALRLLTETSRLLWHELRAQWPAKTFPVWEAALEAAERRLHDAKRD